MKRFTAATLFALTVLSASPAFAHDGHDGRDGKNAKSDCYYECSTTTTTAPAVTTTTTKPAPTTTTTVVSHPVPAPQIGDVQVVVRTPPASVTPAVPVIGDALVIRRDAATGGELAATGSTPWGKVALGVGLLAAGGLLLLFARKGVVVS